MKRLALILAGVVVAGGVAATPAIAGLAGNPSFSHEIPVPVPSAAKTPIFADVQQGDDRGGKTPEAEPSDDRGGKTPEAEPSDDRGDKTREAEPSDDHGSQTPEAEPSDDHGSATPSPEPTDDSGGHGGGQVKA
jgi:hypothetical protein